MLGADRRLPRRRPAATYASTAAAPDHQLVTAGLEVEGCAHAHALHAPYWWFSCAVGVHDDTPWPVRRYHQPWSGHDPAPSTMARPCRADAQPLGRQESRRLHVRRPRCHDAGPHVEGVLDTTAARRGGRTVETIAARQLPGRQHPVVHGRTTPTRGTSSKPRWRSMSAARHDGPRRASRGSGDASDLTARGTSTTSVTGRAPCARHQLTAIRRHRHLAPLPRDRRRAPPATRLADGRTRDRLRGDQQRRAARSRGAATIPTTRRRAAHRVVVCPPQPPVRAGDRAAPRSRPTRLGVAIGRARGTRSAAPRGVPRPVALVDGLVLPRPRRRAPRQAGNRAPRRELAHLRGRRPRRALRVGPTLGHHRRDLRARPRPRHARRCRRAHDLLAWSNSSRDDDGSYWTGANFAGERFDDPGQLFPVERTT